MCPAEAFSLVCQLSAVKTSLGRNFEIHNLGPFLLSESQLLLEYSLSSTSCWVSPHHQQVDTSNYCHERTCFQTCNHDTREHDDLLQLAHGQRILALVAGAGLWTCRAFHVSLSFSRRYRRGCLLFTFPPSLVIHGCFEARYSYVLHFFRCCLSVSRSTRM